MNFLRRRRSECRLSLEEVPRASRYDGCPPRVESKRGGARFNATRRSLTNGGTRARACVSSLSLCRLREVTLWWVLFFGFRKFFY